MSDASSDAQEMLFEEAYNRVLPEYESLSADELIGINLDIPKTVNVVIGAGQRLARLTARIAEELPEFDLELINRLDEYAMALSHAHTLFSLANESADPLQPLVEEGRKLRATLLADAGALVRRGHLGEGRLKDLRGPKAHQNIAFDLQLLAALFRETLSQIAAKSGVQLDELLRAEQIAASIVRAIGAREKATARLRAAADIRVRAFTLLTRKYDQARRAVTYLRWAERDVQKIAPSLYTGRGGRGRRLGEPAAIPAEEKERAAEESAGSSPLVENYLAGSFPCTTFR